MTVNLDRDYILEVTRIKFGATTLHHVRCNRGRIDLYVKSLREQYSNVEYYEVTRFNNEFYYTPYGSIARHVVEEGL